MVIHLRASAGRFLVLCHALATPTNWTDRVGDVTCPACFKKIEGR